jgi:prevent-host-death family protein
MEEIAISEFQATCSAVLARVAKTRKPILVTRFGKPVAEIVPPRTKPRRESWLGCMSGTAKMLDDLVAPTVDETE